MPCLLVILACVGQVSRDPATATPQATAGNGAPTVTPVASPTPTASPTATTPPSPTAPPSPTPSPVPTADPRFGLIVTSHVNAAETAILLSRAGVSTYIKYNLDIERAGGKEKLLFMSSPGILTEAEVRQKASAAPGSVWYLIGEPNAWGITVESAVEDLHDVYGWIKDADPTAKITSPSILNFEFTCEGCGGIPSGHDWIDAFRTLYKARWGEDPPIDIWAIDVFPIDWSNVPMLRSDIVIEQLVGFREYLDAIPSERGKPIWITEFGTHWGYERIEFPESCNGRPVGGGQYQTDAVKAYLDEVVGWLVANSDDMNIQRWYLYSSYNDIHGCGDHAYAGITVFDNSGVTGRLSEIGRHYRDWATGAIRN